MKENRTKTVARYGLLVALAMIMSYLEAQLPVFFAIPGMKLGLTNVVVLVALYGMGYGSAAVINLVRIVLVSMLFGNGMSLAYSLAGGILSGAVMMLLKRTKMCIRDRTQIAEGGMGIETRVTDIDGVTVMEVIDDERFYDAFDWEPEKGGFQPRAKKAESDTFCLLYTSGLLRMKKIVLCLAERPLLHFLMQFVI